MLRLHTNVYAKPSVTQAGCAVTLRGIQLATLSGESALGGRNGPPKFDRTFPVTFEEVQSRLAGLPRTDIEPDGFFLVTGHHDGAFWRLNGHMHEHAGQMHRVELHGECPSDTLDAVLQTFGWPKQQLVFELVREGVTLGEQEFRRWAGATEDCS